MERAAHSSTPGWNQEHRTASHDDWDRHWESSTALQLRCVCFSITWPEKPCGKRFFSDPNDTRCPTRHSGWEDWGWKRQVKQQRRTNRHFGASINPAAPRRRRHKRAAWHRWSDGLDLWRDEMRYKVNSSFVFTVQSEDPDFKCRSKHIFFLFSLINDQLCKQAWYDNNSDYTNECTFFLRICIMFYVYA